MRARGAVERCLACEAVVSKGITRPPIPGFAALYHLD